jgi:hypothetical protein
MLGYTASQSDIDREGWSANMAAQPATCVVCGTEISFGEAPGASGACAKCAGSVQSPNEFFQKLQASGYTPADRFVPPAPSDERNPHAPPPNASLAAKSATCLACGAAICADSSSAQSGLCSDCAGTVRSPNEFFQSLEASNFNAVRKLRHVTDEIETRQPRSMQEAISRGDSPLLDTTQPRRDFSSTQFLGSLIALLAGLSISVQCVLAVMTGKPILCILFGIGPGLLLAGLAGLFFWYTD